MAAQSAGSVDVDFEAEKEVWNVYELSDGSVIRMKTLLLKLFRIVPPGGAPAGSPAGEQYSSSFQNVMTVKKTSPKLKGPRATAPVRITEKSPRLEVQFTPLVEDFNVYRLETGDVLKVKLVTSLVYRIKDAWDQFGDPVYQVSSTNVITPVKRPTLA